MLEEIAAHVVVSGEPEDLVNIVMYIIYPWSTARWPNC